MLYGAIICLTNLQDRTESSKVVFYLPFYLLFIQMSFCPQAKTVSGCGCTIGHNVRLCIQLCRYQFTCPNHILWLERNYATCHEYAKEFDVHVRFNQAKQIHLVHFNSNASISQVLEGSRIECTPLEPTWVMRQV